MNKLQAPSRIWIDLRGFDIPSTSRIGTYEQPSVFKEPLRIATDADALEHCVHYVRADLLTNTSDSARRAAEEWKDAGGDVWEIRLNVDCVECPHCGFTFAAVHTDGHSNGYSCPNCEGCPDAAAPADNDAERGEEESGYPNLRDGEMPLG